MTYDADSYFNRLPNEVLLLIFSSLPAKELTLCRRVCVRFKQVIDSFSRKDSLWQEFCKEDLPDIYEVARNKARPGLSWYHMYRSLSLWPKLSLARERRDEFAAAATMREEIQNFKILRDGVIGVHKKGAIVYYDIETLDKSKRPDISGEYLNYSEDEDTIVILGYQLHLFIIRKSIRNPKYEPNVTYDNVKCFILVNKRVFYVTMDEEIYVCHLEDGKLNNQFLAHSEDGIMCLGFTEFLHVLTFQRIIYTIYEEDLMYGCCLGPESNILHQLREYNLLERMDWRIYNQWMYVLNHTIPEGPLRDIVTVRVYGDVVFVGSNWGVLRIYYAPYTGYEFDLFNSEPVKQFNFVERSDCPVLSMCPIIQIDVLEAEEGHTVIVAMPKKIAVLEFTHNHKRSASVAMLPYADVQKVKVLKIESQ